MQMEQIECSETSSYKIQMPGNYPEESTQHSEHDENLKSRTPWNTLAGHCPGPTVEAFATQEDHQLLKYNLGLKTGREQHPISSELRFTLVKPIIHLGPCWKNTTGTSGLGSLTCWQWQSTESTKPILPTLGHPNTGQQTLLHGLHGQGQ